MPLASSIFVAFVGFAGILNQSVEGKPKVAMLRDGNSGKNRLHTSNLLREWMEM